MVFPAGRHLLTLTTLLALPLLVPPPFSEAAVSDALDPVWDVARLYDNKENSLIQKISLVGRYHGQYWYTESDDESADDWENRRFYVGFNAEFLHNFTLEVQMSINDDFDPVYKSLYDAYLKWTEPESGFNLSVGRLDYVYTGMERTTSSKKIKTLERALLVNQLMPGEVVGIYATGKTGGVTCQAGIFSGSIEDEFTSFDGGYGALVGLSTSLPLIYDEGTLHLDYLYNDGDEDNNAFKPYEHIVSLWHEGTIGPWEFGIDFTFGSGVDETSDVFGMTLLPTWTFAKDLIFAGDSLQLALRYHYGTSDDAFGLSFNKRYEQEVVSGRGDLYNSLYAGLNWYVYEQKLNLMAGIEYFDMDGVEDSDNAGRLTSVDGYSFITGIRLYF